MAQVMMAQTMMAQSIGRLVLLFYLCGRLVSHAWFFNLGGFGW